MIKIKSLWQSLSCVCEEVSSWAEGKRLVERMIHLTKWESNHFFLSLHHSQSLRGVPRCLREKSNWSSNWWQREKVFARKSPSLQPHRLPKPESPEIKQHRKNVFFISYQKWNVDLAFSSFFFWSQDHCHSLSLYLGRENIWDYLLRRFSLFYLSN